MLDLMRWPAPCDARVRRQAAAGQGHRGMWWNTQLRAAMSLLVGISHTGGLSHCPSGGRWCPACAAAVPTGAANVAECAAGNSTGSKCTPQCLQGFTANGSAPYTCDADGNWTGGKIECRRIKCPSDRTMKGMDPHAVPCPAAEWHGEKAPVCFPTCEYGYQDGNKDSYYCTEPGRWTGGYCQCHALSCATAVPQGADPHAENCTAGSFGGDGCLLNTCQQGYVASGHSRYSCVPVPPLNVWPPLAKWLPVGGNGTTNLTCHAILCGAMQPVAHANKCPAATAVGDACLATCQSGYVADDNSDPTFVCGADGYWTGKNGAAGLSCLPVQCYGSPVANAKGCVGYKYGDGKTCPT
eukprot:COSAG05_NODE_5527_length_1151_cov_1.013308_1_plen_353_part_10